MNGFCFHLSLCPSSSFSGKLSLLFLSFLFIMCSSDSVPASSSSANTNVDKHYVFVYGTLKRGFRNHYNMEHADIHYACSGVTLQKLPLYMDPLQRNRPCLANVKGVGHNVRGELYRVTASQLESLDEFERVPTHYHRELLPMQVDADCQSEESGRVVSAHVYFINVNEDAKRKIQEREEIRLIDDYTFADHKTYVSRKELEEKARLEREPAVLNMFEREGVQRGSRPDGSELESSSGSSALSDSESETRVEEGLRNDGSWSCRSSRMEMEEKSPRSYEGSGSPMCLCF
eukprot:GHVS01058180.1.p1 GENE.GHVS01058180.1~~GHVS01058180.1.p1  ORF type:complete len:289 (+),score=35.52 GHVS01058180.1:99-965(+)